MASVVGPAVIGGMTEAAVGSFLSKLSQEVSRIHAFQEDLEALKSQFTILQGFVQSAYYNDTKMEGYVLKWVENVEDHVLQAEDVLKECSSSISSTGLSKVPQNASKKWKISRRISRLNKELRIMEELAVHHGLSWQQAHLPSPPIEESDVKTASILFDESFTVGLDAKLSEFRSLVEAHPRIGVVGMGGIGKTRLLKHVFKEKQSRFELSIWLSVSQIYDIKSLQLDILHEISYRRSEMESLSKVTTQRRAEKIHEALEENSCLIVLDDVWSSDPTRIQGSLQENDLLKALGVPDSVKILVSTRRSDVVRDMRAYHYQMQHLSEDDSKKLFCLHAFGNPDFHDDDEERLVKIREGCRNLPLALKTTARVLALEYQGNAGRFPLPDEEEEVRAHTFANEDLDPVMHCLMRSYNVLPIDMKRCFAYMAIFPEDYEMDGSKLVTLWMAEGFVSSAQGGQNVLRQLCDRCLLEVVPADWDDWYLDKPITYKMHDLIRDLAISIFHHMRDFCKGSADELRRVFMCKRRVSLRGIRNSDRFRLSDFCGLQLRSLLVYGNIYIDDKFFRRAKGLRVLSIPFYDILKSDPRVMKASFIRSRSTKVLSHLLFLEIQSLHRNEWVRDARSLEYLVLHDMDTLPSWIGELSRLTHLEIRPICWAVGKGLGKLVNLSVLMVVEINDEFSFRALSNLQSLNVLHCSTELTTSKIEEWTPPHSMQCLSFVNWGDEFHMPENWEAMTNIQCLRLYSVSLTAGCQAFQKLVHLVLEDCSGNPPAEIAKLPRLTALRLASFKSCSALPEEYGMAWAFTSLEHFVIAEFPLLPRLPSLEKKAMRSLRTLAVRRCPHFNINEPPHEFSTRLLSSEEDLWCGWVWKFKESDTTLFPLSSYYLDCGRHTLEGLQYVRVR